jgi:hypothetical protein
MPVDAFHAVAAQRHDLPDRLDVDSADRNSDVTSHFFEPFRKRYLKDLFYLIRNEDKPMGVVDAAWGFEDNLVGWWPEGWPSCADCLLGLIPKPAAEFGA